MRGRGLRRLWGVEVSGGRVVVVAWFERGGKSWAHLVVGGLGGVRGCGWGSGEDWESL